MMSNVIPFNDRRPAADSAGIPGRVPVAAQHKIPGSVPVAAQPRMTGSLAKPRTIVSAGEPAMRIENGQLKTTCVTGPAKCLCCRHEWHAVIPVGTVNLQCPKCATMRGVIINPITRPDEMQLECKCGSQVFSITPQRIYCPRCGTAHRPFDNGAPHG